MQNISLLHRIRESQAQLFSIKHHVTRPKIKSISYKSFINKVHPFNALFLQVLCFLGNFLETFHQPF